MKINQELFYAKVLNALALLPAKVMQDIAGLTIRISYDTIHVNNLFVSAGIWDKENQEIVLYPFVCVEEARGERISMQKFLNRLVQHEVAHIYGLSHEDIEKRFDKNKQKFNFADLKFPYKKS